jgi:hypothetical protein
MTRDDLHSSKHNPDFVDRTLPIRVEIENILAKLRRQLTMVVNREDQAALNDLYVRVKKADMGFDDKVILAV